jgi:endonuclease III
MAKTGTYTAQSPSWLHSPLIKEGPPLVRLFKRKLITDFFIENEEGITFQKEPQCLTYQSIPLSEAMTASASPAQILNTLKKLYPNARSELNFDNEYQLAVAVMLSAQCTDKKVNETTVSLFKKFPNFEKLAQASLAAVEEIIRPVNYYKTKSKNLIETAARVVTDFKGKLPADLEALTTLPGIGRKTANVILAETGAAETLPVDTHVLRVSNRLGLVGGDKPDIVEEELKAQFKPKDWRQLHHSLILHGRRVCKAKNPSCAECGLNQVCPSAFKT